MTSQVIALAFEGRYEAEGMLKTIQDMQEKGLLTLEDAVLAYREKGGQIQIKQTQSHTGKTALKGSGIGLLAGLLLGGPIGGLAAGAAIGAVTGSMKDHGVDDNFIKGISEGLRPDTSAIFLMVKDVKREEVTQELRKFKAVVLSTSLSEEQHKNLERVLAKEDYSE